MAIDISFPLGPQQQTHRTMLQREDETDRQTDERTDTVPIRKPRSASADSADKVRTTEGVSGRRVVFPATNDS